MALLWVDGFEKYGTINSSINPSRIINWKYRGVSDQHLEVVDGRHGGAALKFDTSAVYMETPDFGSGDDTLICGFAFKLRDMDDGVWLCNFRHPRSDGVAAYDQLTFEIASGATNEVRVRLGNTILDTSTGVDLQTDTWYYFEGKVKCHDSTGTVNAYIDGTEVCTFSGDTKHREDTSYSRVVWSLVAIADELTIDDLYVADGSGSGVTDVLGGDTRVETLSPTSDASGNWSCSTGSDRYALVDEDQQDANYIYDDTTGNQAVFELGNLSAAGATGTVEGVMLSCDSQQNSRFTKYAKCITQNGSGGTIQDEGNFMPGTDNPLCYTVIMEDDPDGNTWSASTVNSLRAGVEVS